MDTYTLKVFPKNKTQLSAIKAFMSALKIKFELYKEKPYSAEFIKKIQEAEKQIEEGRSTTVNSEDFDKLLWK